MIAIHNMERFRLSNGAIIPYIERHIRPLDRFYTNAIQRYALLYDDMGLSGYFF